MANVHHSLTLSHTCATAITLLVQTIHTVSNQERGHLVQDEHQRQRQISDSRHHWLQLQQLEPPLQLLIADGFQAYLAFIRWEKQVQRYW